MRYPRLRIALLAAFGMSLVSCNDAPSTLEPRPIAPGGAAHLLAAAPQVVISQVYGGGGNSGATYKNDFIELYNAGTVPVSLDGWSVQYASSSGTSWTNKTNLSGTLAPGAYYLVQEAAGSGGTADLPTPNATGSIAMSGTAAKVALVSSTTSLTGACPVSDATVVDFVGYGTGSSGASCFEGTAAAPTLSNTTAAIRKSNGAQDTNNNGADFATGAPTPRSSAPSGGSGGGAFDHVVIAGSSSVNANATITLTANLQDASNQNLTDPAATYAWTSANPSVVAIQSTSGNTATIKGVTVGGPIAITVTATSNGVPKTSAPKQITVVAPPSNISVNVGAGTPLVIGYESQVFASGTDQSGNSVFSGNVTWSTSDPSILVVTDPRGVVRAVGNGSAKVIATAADGSTGSFTLSTEVPFYNANARVGHNTEFGVPADADASNDVIIAREQYILSYNPQRGGPNWVSWDLSATHLGTRNRCNCYSADTALARLGYGQFMYNTADYTGSGYDRGHMQPSADQTATDGENARTFFMTNFLPQKHGLNAGPWEDLENELRDSVRAGREAYVIAGGVFTNGVGLGTVNNAGKIAIPDSTWKIVLLMPAGTGLANVSSASDVTVIAVNMPNVDNPGPNDWTQYRTTVGRIQKSTGYDFLAALPDPIECKVEAVDCAPTAHVTGTGLTGGSEGATLAFDASTSSDPDAGDVLSYQWSVNGQTVGIQPALNYTFADNGTYAVRLIVGDLAGKGDTAVVNVTIANVAPAVSLDATTSLSILSGQSVAVTGTFTDPGVDSPWQYQLAWGSGAPQTGSLGTSGASVNGSHQYLAAGQYTVTFTVTDKDGAAATRTLAVNVGRVSVAGEANPSSIELNDKGNGNISVRLTSSADFDVSTIDRSTIRIGTVEAERDHLEQGGRRLSLDFSRKALIASGALNASSTELVLTATLTNGVQIVSRIPVSVH